MIKPPLALALTFCRSIGGVPGEGIFLKGIINALDYPHFPSRRTSLTVFTALTGGAGEGRLSLEIAQMGAAEPRTVYRKLKWCHFPEDPLMIVIGEFTTTRLVFPRPGVYLASLRFEDYLVTERRLVVSQR